MRALLVALALWAAPAAAQDWSFIDPLMAESLDIRAGEGGATLFPDSGDPDAATVALGFFYYGNRDGGNAIDLNVGLFRRAEAGWSFAGPVTIYGEQPRDPVFTPGQIEITTTMPGPNDARCCPSVPTRWIVDTGTLAVTRVN